MIRKLLPYLLLLSAVVSLFGWMNAYVTLATNDQKAYVSVLWQAFFLLGVSQVMLIAVATQKNRLFRSVAIVLFLLNCMPIYHSMLRAPYVFS